MEDQFLNITCLFLWSASLVAAFAPAPVIVIVPFTNICALLSLHGFDFYIEVLNLS